MSKIVAVGTLAVLCVYAFGSGAAGQESGSPPPRDTVFFVANAQPVAPFGGQFLVVGAQGQVPGAVVVGKPYSAQSVTESTQMLVDGNRISQRNEARVFRDGEGRTRLEQTLRGIAPWATAREPVELITINDPVAGLSYVLEPGARKARQLRPVSIAAGVAGASGAWEGAAPAIPPLPPLPTVAADFTMTTAPIGAASFSFSSTVVPEDLGEQVLEGVLTHGTRSTRTIPAGELGNERPIEIVAEQWFSPELEAVVLRRNYDPRVGETVYRLTNVVLGEPSPDLFLVPQGYELIVEPEAGPRAPLSPPAPGEARIERRVFQIRPEPPRD